MTATTGDRIPVAFPLPPGLDTPAVVIDIDIVERNIATMAAALAARGVRLRPHVKTHKSVELARLQLAAGAAGITVGTIGEAEVFAGAGIDDIFIAYPIWTDGPKAVRLQQLHEQIRLSVGVDSAEAAAALGRAVRGTQKQLRVLVEVDSGERRTGVATAEAAVTVAIAARDAGLELRGVFTHGGHAYHSPETVAEAANDEVTRLEQVAAALEAEGFEVAERSAGSTPTAVLSATAGITEERPGTYVFGDRQQVALGSVDAGAVGLAVAATVVSDAVDGQIVVDAGAKTLARDRPSFLDGIAAVPALGGAVVDRAYDYHGVIHLDGGARPRPGEVLALIPNHVCPVVNLADELIVVRSGRLVARWPVDARGRNG